MGEKWQRAYVLIMGVIFTWAVLAISSSTEPSILLKNRLWAAGVMFLGPGLVMLVFRAAVTKFFFIHSGLTRFIDAMSEQKARGHVTLFGRFLVVTGAAISVLSLIMFFFQR